MKDLSKIVVSVARQVIASEQTAPAMKRVSEQLAEAARILSNINSLNGGYAHTMWAFQQEIIKFRDEFNEFAHLDLPPVHLKDIPHSSSDQAGEISIDHLNKAANELHGSLGSFVEADKRTVQQKVWHILRIRDDLKKRI